MADLQYRDPADGVFKDALNAPAGAPGAQGPTGPAGPSGGGPPVGSIMAYAGSAAPTGWHLCDGTAHGSAALEAVMGSTLTPDMRDRFVCGVSATKASLSIGGAATVTLTAAQSGLPSHTHTATDTHAHTFDPPAATSVTALTTHNHALTGYLFAETANSSTKTSDAGDNNYHNVTSYSTLTGATTVAHAHAVNLPALVSTSVDPGVTVAAVAAASATESHENLPPYYALVFVIRTV